MTLLKNKTDAVVSVSEFTNTIKLLLENQIGTVSIEGEISNYKPHYSGHKYFTLKDDKAQISCTMWKSRSLDFELADGMKAVATGNISVYPPRGSYQLDVISIVPSGVGDLFRAFEELKQKLFALGYFDEDNKKNLPAMPLNIGVSTSPTGAAVKDIFSTIKRRFPAATIYFRPTIVQGNEAAPDIANAIKHLQNTPADIIIVGRGGGSIEDLWAYNTEIVANAIYECSVPIISAVGHETDFSISDFVADVRAATPTAAAELATPQNYMHLVDTIVQMQDYMQQAMSNNISDFYDLLGNMTATKAYKRINEKININHQTIDLMESALRKDIKYKIEKGKIQLKNLTMQTELLHPLSPLNRGFALLKHKGKIINNNESLSKYKNFEVIRATEKVSVKFDKILNDELF